MMMSMSMLSSAVQQWVASFRLREQVLYGAVIFSALVLGLVLFRAFVPSVGVSVNAPIPVVGVSYGNTRAVVYRLDYCKTVSPLSLVHRELRAVDQPSVPVIVSLYSSGFVLEKGCHVIDIVEPIPAYVPPGRYVMAISFVFRTNAVTQPPILETEPFSLP